MTRLLPASQKRLRRWRDGVVYVGLASAEEDNRGARKSCCVSRSLVRSQHEDQEKTVADLRCQAMMVEPTAIAGIEILGHRSQTKLDLCQHRKPLFGSCCRRSLQQGRTQRILRTLRRRLLPNSVLALDLHTGAIKWSHRALAYDTWNVGCSGHSTKRCGLPARTGLQPSGSDCAASSPWRREPPSEPRLSSA